MTRIRKSAIVPYSTREMYSLAADVEGYPRFLPWCAGAEVLSRTDNQVIARLSMAKGPVRYSFTTRNTLEESRRIDMHLLEGPFKRLHGFWTFEPLGANGCMVTLHMDFEFASRLLAASFGKAFNKIANTMVDAFCDRARQIHGGC